MRGPAYILFLLILIALSLGTVFTFLTSSTIGVLEGLALFLAVTGLMVIGYALAIIFLAFVGIFFLTRLCEKPRSKAH